LLWHRTIGPEFEFGAMIRRGMESEPDEIESEHEPRHRAWSLRLRVAVAVTIGAAFVASSTLEGDEQKTARTLFYALLVFEALVRAAYSWRDATFEERCRRIGELAFWSVMLVYHVLNDTLSTAALIAAILVWLFVLCVDMYRSLDAARPNYGSPPLRAG